MQSVEQAAMPMEWVSRRIVELRSERDRLERTLPTRTKWRPLSADEIEAMATLLGGLMRTLQNASPTDRAAVYAQLGLRLTYEPRSNQVRAEVDLARGPGGVGGGNGARALRPLLVPGDWIELRRAG